MLPPDPVQPHPSVNPALQHVYMLALPLANVSQAAITELTRSSLRKPLLHCSAPTPTDQAVSPCPTVLIDGETLGEARRRTSLVPMATDKGYSSKRSSTRNSSVLSTQDMVQLPPSTSHPHLLGLHPHTYFRSRSFCHASGAQNRRLRPRPLSACSLRPHPLSACSLRPGHFPVTLHSRQRQNPYCSLGMQLPLSRSTLIGAGLYNSVDRQSECAGLTHTADTRVHPLHLLPQCRVFPVQYVSRHTTLEAQKDSPSHRRRIPSAAP